MVTIFQAEEEQRRVLVGEKLEWEPVDLAKSFKFDCVEFCMLVHHLTTE